MISKKENIRIKCITLQPLFKDSGLSVYKLNRILNLIIIRNLYNEKDYITSEIMGKKLQSICRDYKKYLDFLNYNNIIYIIKAYEVGKSSRRYGIHHLFQVQLKEWEFYFENERTRSEPNIIDNDVKKRIKKDYFDLRIYDKPHNLSYKKYLNDLLNLSKFKQGPNLQYQWKLNRLYTSFSFCSKETRLNCFKWEKDWKGKFGSLDIQSSFPTFLNYLLRQQGIKEFELTHEYFDYYEWLIFKLGIYMDRDEMKIYFQRLINTKLNLDETSNKKFQRFYEVFPETSKFIHKIKLNGSMYDLLTKTESNWLFNVVIKRLYDEIPNIQIVTCHDQIYFDKFLYGKKVFNIWQDEIKKIK